MTAVALPAGRFGGRGPAEGQLLQDEQGPPRVIGRGEVTSISLPSGLWKGGALEELDLFLATAVDT